MKILETEIPFKDRNLVVVYTLSGKYFPTTLETPEEFLDMEIKNIFFNDKNVTTFLSEKSVNEISEILMSKILTN